MDAALQAAGKSSRFWPIAEGHKSLLKIAGKTLIERSIDSLSFADKIVIVEPPSQCISKEIKRRNVEFRVQQEPKGTWDAFLIGAEGLEDFIYLSGYHYDFDMLQKISQLPPPALVIKRVKRPQDYGVACFQNGMLCDIVEKPKTPPSDFAVGSIYHLNSDFYSYLKHMSFSYTKFDLLPYALSKYISKFPANFVEVTPTQLPSLKYPWHALDIMDLLLRGVVIEKGAKVEGQIVGPAYIGRGAVVKGDVVSSSIEAGAFVEGEVINSLIGEGAEVRGHLEHSIVGRGSVLDVEVKAGSIPCKVKGVSIIPNRPFGAAFAPFVDFSGKLSPCTLIG